MASLQFGLLVAACGSFSSPSGTVPDVVNHNLETVARLQRAVRPLAGAQPPSPAVNLVVAYLGELGVELTPEMADRPTFKQRVIEATSTWRLSARGA